MPSTLTISGTTFTNPIARVMPTIPNLSTLVYWGTGGDGIETNRNPGGPALAVLSGTPVHSATYVSLGAQSGRNDVIDSQNTRSAGVLASGWTWAAVARATAASVQVANDFLSTSQTIAMGLYMTTASKVGIFQNGSKATITTIKATTDWHFVALTFAGGATGVITVYDFTENTTTGVPITFTPAGIAAGAFSPRFGSIAGDSFNTGAADVAFGMVSLSPLSAGALSTIAASVRLAMARRGITI